MSVFTQSQLLNGDRPDLMIAPITAPVEIAIER